MRSKFFVFCVILLIVALFATIYLYTNRGFKSKKTEETIKSITLPPKATIELISDRNGLKKYRNNIQRYEIDIPSTWKILRESLYGEGAIIITPSNQTALGLGGTEIFGGSFAEGENYYYMNGVQLEFDRMYFAKDLKHGTLERLFKINSRQVDSQRAVVFVSRTLPGDPTEGSYQIFTWIRPADRNASIANFYIRMLNSNLESTLKYLDDYNQITSSLRFF